MSISDLTDQVTNIKLQSKLGEVVTTSNAMTGTMFDTFIPGGTIIHVELDGSGDFTSLKAALDYLEYKWSNGKVTIQLGEGNFEIPENLCIYATHFANFAFIVIEGISIDKTKILYTSVNSTMGLNIAEQGCWFVIQKMTLECTNTTMNTQYCALVVRTGAMVRISDIKFIGAGIYTYRQGKVDLVENLTFTNTQYAIVSKSGAIISDYSNPTYKYTFNNITYAYCVDLGGIITLNNSYLIKQNVSNLFRMHSTNRNYSPANGVIYYADGSGIIMGKIKQIS